MKYSNYFVGTIEHLVCHIMYSKKIENRLTNKNQRSIGPENAHLKPDLGVLSHHEMNLTLNTHTPLLTS